MNILKNYSHDIQSFTCFGFRPIFVCHICSLRLPSNLVPLAQNIAHRMLMLRFYLIDKMLVQCTHFVVRWSWSVMMASSWPTISRTKKQTRARAIDHNVTNRNDFTNSSDDISGLFSLSHRESEAWVATYWCERRVCTSIRNSFQ